MVHNLTDYVIRTIKFNEYLNQILIHITCSCYTFLIIRELRFGSLRENNLVQESSISVMPVMRAGLVGYVTTKSSVLLKSIPDEVLENAEVTFMG